MLIQLGRPVRTERVRGFQPPWRTVFVYKCEAGHEVRVRANSFLGKRAVPGVGAICCPQCEFAAKYPQVIGAVEAEQLRTAWRAVDQDTGEVIEAQSDDELKQKLKEEHVYRCTKFNPNS